MAKCNIFKVMVALFLMASPVLAQVGIDQEIVPSSGSDIFPPEPADDYSGLPPEPEPGYYEYLEKCADVIGLDCGQEAFRAIFNGTEISVACCHKVVEMGKDCNDGLVKSIIQMPDYKELASKALSRSAEVFNKCVLAVGKGSPIPTPAPSPSST